MRQRKQTALVIEHADVVRWAHFVDLGNQGLRAHHVTQPHAGQAKFAQGAHQQHMRVLDHAVQVSLAGKGLVGFIHHHQATLRPLRDDDLFNALIVPQITRWIIGVGEVDDGRLMRCNGVQHGRFIEFKIHGQRHTMKIQTLELCTHGVHHKTRYRRQDRGPRDITSQCKQGNQFI